MCTVDVLEINMKMHIYIYRKCKTSKVHLVIESADF